MVTNSGQRTENDFEGSGSGTLKVLSCHLPMREENKKTLLQNNQARERDLNFGDPEYNEGVSVTRKCLPVLISSVGLLPFVCDGLDVFYCTTQSIVQH